MTTPVLFLSHGGGPLPLLGDPGHADMLTTYQRIRQKLQNLATRPGALLFISAHWETSQTTATTAATPALYYDYYGFPADAYALTYPVAGAPELARLIVERLQRSGIHAGSDAERGLDHGVFVPALLLFPQADIPCLQLSLIKGLDPAAHLALGAALRWLREQNVMIIGSGFSFHNMQEFFGAGSAQADALNQAFEHWLSETLEPPDAAQREQRLLQWTQAPGARFCHPREEHLMPLHVCLSAANAGVSEQWHFQVLGRQGSCYWWD